MIDIVGRLTKIEKLLGVGAPYLIETWQDVLGIDVTVWTTAITGTGAVARDVTEEPYQKVVLTGPVNADTARIRSVQEWQLAPDTWGANTFQKILIMEWEAKFASVASIDNALFFMGLSASNVATRATDNIAGFILTADALNSITDNGGGEHVGGVGAPVITNWHKYGIVAYPGVIEFYVDEVMQHRHLTVENLPDVNAHMMFYLPQEVAANSGELHVGMISIRPGVIL